MLVINNGGARRDRTADLLRATQTVMISLPKPKPHPLRH